MTTVPAYYNEWDSGAAAWLRELIKEGLISPGEVDERSVAEVRPADLVGFTRHHFFGGIGGWDYALQLAGWPRERPVVTASLPCQPFSSAGKRKGVDDDRHLWPVFLRLVRECRPATCFGEQVDSADGREWLARVQADLEQEGYAVGRASLCAASVGAPHIRQRLFWVTCRLGIASGSGLCGHTGTGVGTETKSHRLRSSTRGVCDNADESGSIDNGRLGDAIGKGRQGRRASVRGGPVDCAGREPPGEPGGGAGGVGDAANLFERGADQRPGKGAGGHAPNLAHDASGLGHWSAFDLVHCRDGKSRRVEPGTFPLAPGLPGRVAALRGYGNSIVPQVAALFVRAFLEAEAEGLNL